MALREQILKTIDGYLEGFNTNTPEGTIAHRTPDCKHRIIPDSDQVPVRSNEEYRDFMGPSFGIMKNFHLKLLEGVDPIVDVDARKAVLHLTSSAETPLGPYKNTYIFTFHFTEDGTQIDHVLEFADTKTVSEFVPAILKWIADNVPGAAPA
jgi:hypothetical protein